MDLEVDIRVRVIDYYYERHVEHVRFEEANRLDMVILDFSKAFNTVPHNQLLLKSENYGI